MLQKGVSGWKKPGLPKQHGAKSSKPEDPITVDLWIREAHYRNATHDLNKAYVECVRATPALVQAFNMELVTRDQLVLAASNQLLDRQRSTFSSFDATLAKAQTSANRFHKMLTEQATKEEGEKDEKTGAAAIEGDFIDASSSSALGQKSLAQFRSRVLRHRDALMRVEQRTLEKEAAAATQTVSLVSGAAGAGGVAAAPTEGGESEAATAATSGESAAAGAEGGADADDIIAPLTSTIDLPQGFVVGSASKSSVPPVIAPPTAR
jgi:hypothetical protein